MNLIIYLVERNNYMVKWSFYNKTIFMWGFVLILSLLDFFVPNDFYKNIINEFHIFKWLSMCLILSGLIGSIVCKFNRE